MAIVIVKIWLLCLSGINEVMFVCFWQEITIPVMQKYCTCYSYRCNFSGVRFVGFSGIKDSFNRFWFGG